MDIIGRCDKPGAAKNSPTSSQWNDVKLEIEELYITRNLTIWETMAEMKKRGFFATHRMYKSKLAEWEMGKNATREDWLGFARLHQEHAVTGISEIYIQIHNKIRRMQDLRRYLKNHDEDEGAFLAEALISQAPIPKHVHLYFPGGREIEVLGGKECAATDVVQNQVSPISTPQQLPENRLDGIGTRIGFSVGPGESIPTAPGSQIAELGSVASETQPSTTYPMQDLRPENSQFASATEADSQDFGAFDTDILSDQFGDNREIFLAQLEGLSDYSTFQCVSAGDINEMRQNVGGEALQRFSSPKDPTSSPVAENHAQLQSPRSPGADHNAEDAYTAACMMACMLGAAKRKDKMQKCLDKASISYRQMCRFHSPSMLTAATVVLTWLLVHADANLSEIIMAATLDAAAEEHGVDNPVCLLLTWMTASVVGSKLRACRIGAAELEEIWRGFRLTLGEEHGHTIVALYCLSFHLMFADKKNYAQAEEHLLHLSTVSARAFGTSYIMTINILASLSRAQQRQGKFMLALETINAALREAPLGLNHPHRLELLLRKALILRKLERWDETEELYWIVVKGRVATLGLHHKSTMAAHESLVWVLQRNGTWETRKDEVHRLLVDPQVSVSDYESWWRRFVEANRASGTEDLGSSDEE